MIYIFFECADTLMWFHDFPETHAAQPLLNRVASGQGKVRENIFSRSGNFVESQGILGFFGRSGKSQGIMSHVIFKFYKCQCLSISDAYNFFFQFMSVKSN